MNCKEANKISIREYLSTQGMQPVKSVNGQAWYNSPIRRENKPSLKVNEKLNQWYDFGTGENGTLIDLICRIYNLNAAGALIHLQRPDVKINTFSFGQQEEFEEFPVNIIQISKITNTSLIRYILNRAVSMELAHLYLKEIFYSVRASNRTYWALGFENDLSGWELRNPIFKGCVSPKFQTTIPGNGSLVNLFEGFFDFLSCLQDNNVKRLKYTSIILNGLTNLNHIQDQLKNFEGINLFLDNDQAGRQAAEKIKTTYPQVTDYSQIIYPDHKDYNDLCVAKPKNNL